MTICVLLKLTSQSRRSKVISIQKSNLCLPMIIKKLRKFCKQSYSPIHSNSSRRNSTTLSPPLLLYLVMALRMGKLSTGIPHTNLIRVYHRHTPAIPLLRLTCQLSSEIELLTLPPHPLVVLPTLADFPTLNNTSPTPITTTTNNGNKTSKCQLCLL